ncbi:MULTISPECIES: hypothetical protein [unclassified Amycolatopsis]|uniref:hypothetical protein n=1 Tax=unclassified Amycolatopsis TaxID=2618356 RepID=UPI00287610BE|nr:MULTISPECIES: hypothetical protein [unclassified Amycolatopsis]MDS0139527.1 hypothetical protein [Amycolatopsis sp. 505]MDS0147106.1 hypothetical protein [Amycolatopsis sp. CM201R]
MSMLRKAMGVAVLAGAAMLTTDAAASAASGPEGAPTAADTAAIGRVTGGPDTLGRLAETKFPGSHAATVARQSADPRTQVPVYEPTAAFVAGKSDVPAALAYVAVPAKTGDGTPATVWAERQGPAWTVVNVASGDYERQYAQAAAGGYLLHEPQVNAWYAVHGDAVTVLEGSVTGLAAGTKLSLADYRAALHRRYADKLPGSAYDRDGAGGGYGGRERAVPAADPGDVPALPFVLGGVLVLAAGAAAVPRLRRR